MESYDTLVEAIQGLKKKGFVHDFNLESHCLSCAPLNLELHPEDFEIIEHHRFEGMSDPNDNSVIYALQSKDGIKGILVDAYGPYAESLTPEMAAKLRTAHP